MLMMFAQSNASYWTIRYWVVFVIQVLGVVSEFFILKDSLVLDEIHIR